MGLSHTAIAPYDAYPTSDGEILIGVQNDRGWRALVTDVLDAPELADDPRFATNVSGWRTATSATPSSPRARALDRPPSSTPAWPPRASPPRRSTRPGARPPAAGERDRWRTIDTEHGQTEALLPPATFADVEAPMGQVPALGEHTAVIHAELQLPNDDAAADS